MDVITYSLCNKKAKQYTDTVINNLPKGIVYKGSVNYYNDLPNNAEIGDCYTVLYKGTMFTEPSGLEYVWGVNTATSTEEWILIGSDMTGYVKNTDYATNNIGGVIKINSEYVGIDNNGNIRPKAVGSYSKYPPLNDYLFISKKTLEAVIDKSILLTGTSAPTTATVGYRIGQLYVDITNNKTYELIAIDDQNETYTWVQLVRATDYATTDKAGVIKVNDYYGAYAYDGTLLGSVKQYSAYENQPNSTFICKGTLENVITGKELVNKTYVDNIVGDIESLLVSANTELEGI